VAVNVAKNRFGAPGRATEIEIRYLVDGEHAGSLARFATPQPLTVGAEDQPLSLLRRSA
jgi:hypothetical protein